MSHASARVYAFVYALPLVLLGALTCAHAQDAEKLDVVYVPTPYQVVTRMLEMADVTPTDKVIDLGSGDGRIAIAAVRDRGAQSALGIDLDPERISEAKKNAEQDGVADRVTFEQGDLFKKNISEANVLTLYLLPNLNLRLRPVILDTLQPGSRVVSHAFTMDDWQADRSDFVGGTYVYMWIVPAKVQGRWQVDTGQGSFTLDLQQRFQVVDGLASMGGQQRSVEGSLEGAELRFTVGEHLYVGRVEGERITAIPAEGAATGWSARRS